MNNLHKGSKGDLRRYYRVYLLEISISHVFFPEDWLYGVYRKYLHKGVMLVRFTLPSANATHTFNTDLIASLNTNGSSKS